MTDAVTSERRGAVLIATVDRPQRRNALDPDALVALTGLLADAKRDPEIGALVLTATGRESFGSGMDLHALAEDPVRAGAASNAFRAALGAPDRVPVVAAVNGSAIGGGFELMTRCDLAIAAEHAKFGLPEVKRGLLPGAGATLFPIRIPLAVALELGLTGEPIDAVRAHQLGLVNHVVPAGQVLERAVEIAQRIAANAPLAVAAIRRCMWTAAMDGGTAAWAQTQAEQQVVSASEDAREGLASFREKREPRWKGR